MSLFRFVGGSMVGAIGVPVAAQNAASSSTMTSIAIVVVMVLLALYLLISSMFMMFRLDEEEGKKPK
jgi:flagellar basal body-associated protein FliL